MKFTSFPDAALRRFTPPSLFFFAGFLLAFAQAGDEPVDAEKHWGQWRGPTSTGVAPHGEPPLEWSETNNVRWKVEIPGHGNATPIVWGDRVYVQTAVETEKKGEPAEQPPSRDGDGGRDRRGRGRGRGGRNWMGSEQPTHIYEFVVLALDRTTGKTIWQKTLCQELPHEGGHRDSTQASNSPITDGEHLFAYFGSRGLYCLDMQGKTIWKKDFGEMKTRRSFGEGSSPALYENTIVVNWDHEGQSFIVALDKNTGAQRWKVERDEPTSWATPLILVVDGKPQVMASGSNLIRSYDLITGELVWQCGGMTSNVIPTPVKGHGLVYATSGYRGNMLQAIRYAGAHGDITDSAAVAWKYDGKGTPYVPSPLLYDDSLYLVDSNRAILSCFDAATGKQHYSKQRLESLEGVYASLVGAENRVYVVGRNGTTAVIKHGHEFQLLATNTLDDGFNASPAIVGDAIYLRGLRYLYCIARN